MQTSSILYLLNMSRYKFKHDSFNEWWNNRLPFFKTIFLFSFFFQWWDYRQKIACDLFNVVANVDIFTRHSVVRTASRHSAQDPSPVYTAGVYVGWENWKWFRLIRPFLGVYTHGPFLDFSSLSWAVLCDYIRSHLFVILWRMLLLVTEWASGLFGECQ